jgi:PAS domain S-box-containing protein
MRDLAVRASGLRPQTGCVPYLRERLANPTQAFPGWMWIARGDGTLEFVSQSGLEYSGFTIEKVLAQGLTSEAVPSDDRQRRTEYWRNLLKAEEPREIELRIRPADDNYRWFAVRSYPIRDAGGRLESSN